MTTEYGTREGVAPRPAGGAAPAPVTSRLNEPERIRLAGVRTRERFHAQLDLAAEGFAEQPTANCVLAASRRLCTAITNLAEDMAKTKGGS